MKINKDLIIEDTSKNLETLNNEVETLVGTVLYNGSATSNFTLTDNVANYSYIDIVYGRQSWSMPMMTQRFYPASDKHYECVLFFGYGYSKTSLFIGSEFLSINGKSATFDTDRRITVDFTNNTTRSNTNSIKIYKVIGHK